MLPDYEINPKKKPLFEKLMPYIEFVIMLIIIQSVVTLFTAGQPEDDSIRFRLLAHSDAPADQRMKQEIQQVIEPLIANAVATSGSRQELAANLAELEGKILEVASEISNGIPVSLERTAALFPPKRSGLVIHPQAAYDAYILTIGSGRGDNWWCALFPKICFPDKKDSEPEEEVEKEDEKVTFFVWEWIKGLFA
jgi:stage II sporulation protein R